MEDTPVKEAPAVGIATSAKQAEFTTVTVSQEMKDRGKNAWPTELSDGFAINQLRDQWGDCCCCQPNNHYVISSFDAQQNMDLKYQGTAVLKLQEDAPWSGRCMSFCLPGSRPTVYFVFGQNGELLYRHEKSWTSAANCFAGYSHGTTIRVPCLCCNFPYLKTYDSTTNVLLGTSRYSCNFQPLCNIACQPKFEVFNADGTPLYLLEPSICWSGLCYSGHYQIRDFSTKQILVEDEFIDVWADHFKGFCVCEKRHRFSVKFPAECSESAKATLVGTAVLFDMTLLEQDQRYKSAGKSDTP